MKRIFFSMVAMLCLFGGDAAAQTVKQKVAVYVTGDADAGYKKVIGSKLVTGITRSENYAAVERTADFLAEMAKEQDYQMSGAVSDNQIARLGQQFGVRYVLVADISEVFESMFVSARMIDVQTAQITNSTEASMVVNNMDSLTKLAENVIRAIMWTPTYTEDSVKLQGPYTDFDKLYSVEAPDGYHLATKKEIEMLIDDYRMMGKTLSFPIYADLKVSHQEFAQYFTVEYYSRGKCINTESNNHPYDKWSTTATLIENTDKSSTWSASYISDGIYDFLYEIENSNGQRTKGLTYQGTPKPSITPGYVYMIKNKEDK